LAAISPSAIEVKIPPPIRNKGQAQAFIFAHGPVPLPFGPEDAIRISSTSDECFVRNSDYIKIKVVKRIPKVPPHVSDRIIGSITARGIRPVIIAHPEDGIELAGERNADRVCDDHEWRGSPLHAGIRFFVARLG
jgi:hypothetical protein